MPFAPRYAAPESSFGSPLLPALLRAAAGGNSVFVAPEGYLPADGLAAVLRAQGRRLVWARLDREDRDPAALLLSLLAALRRAYPEAGQATLDQMRRQPGPLDGWSTLFASLGAALAETLEAGGALVLSETHQLDEAPTLFSLLTQETLALLPPSVPCILTGASLPRTLPPQTTIYGLSDLRMHETEAHAAAVAAGCRLSSELIQRAVRLSEGRTATLSELWAAGALLGSAPLGQALRQATSLDDLLNRIVRAWVVLASNATCRGLSLAVELGYLHPELLAAAAIDGAPPTGPWIEPLAGAWSRLRTLWRPALLTALRGRFNHDQAVLLRVAARLAELGAIEQAVQLYLHLGACNEAAQAIAATAGTLMSQGQWATLDGWLSQLPTVTLEHWPTLVYTGGELAAADGRIERAQRTFALATRLFSAAHDSAGACQSLLAESALARWRGDRAQAEARARAALERAGAEGAPWFECWAAWHLGCLAVEGDDLEAAGAFFAHAAEVAASLGEPLLVAVPRQAQQLTLYQHELREQLARRREAYAAAEADEAAHAVLLRQMLSEPPANLEALLDVHGWSQLPLLLKLPMPAPAATLAQRRTGGLWGRLLGALSGRLRTSAEQSPLRFSSAMSAPQAVLTIEAAPGLNQFACAQPPMTATAAASLITAAPAAELARVLGAAEPAPSVTQSVPEQRLQAYLLGSFRLVLDGQSISGIQNGRGMAVFKYLLAHRGRAIPREVLMETFWPVVSPESARNSLNVALHSARQTLRTLGEASLIMHQDGAYRLNPELAIWVDVEAFEQYVQAGRRYERAGELIQATSAYEAALSLYSDDLLADEPYEEWPLQLRERLRMALIETLDRLSQIALSQGDLESCMHLCERLIVIDGCREDVHCRLMRCLSRQGQFARALRQFQDCAAILQRELEVEPAPATVTLAEQIRRREAV